VASGASSECDASTSLGPSRFSPATCDPAARDQGDYYIYQPVVKVGGHRRARQPRARQPRRGTTRRGRAAGIVLVVEAT
jgi:hypothetical protein